MDINKNDVMASVDKDHNGLYTVNRCKVVAVHDDGSLILDNDAYLNIDDRDEEGLYCASIGHEKYQLYNRANEPRKLCPHTTDVIRCLLGDTLDGKRHDISNHIDWYGLEVLDVSESLKYLHEMNEVTLWHDSSMIINSSRICFTDYGQSMIEYYDMAMRVNELYLRYQIAKDNNKNSNIVPHYGQVYRHTLCGMLHELGVRLPNLVQLRVLQEIDEVAHCYTCDYNNPAYGGVTYSMTIPYNGILKAFKTLDHVYKLAYRHEKQ